MNVLPNSVGRPLVGLAAAQPGLSGMIGGELGADGTVAVLLLDVGGAADELFGRPRRRRTASRCRRYRPTARSTIGVVLELGHLQEFRRGATAPSLDR